MQIYSPNSCTTEKKNHFLIFMKNYKVNSFKMSLNMKNIITLLSEKKKWISGCDDHACD